MKTDTTGVPDHEPKDVPSDEKAEPGTTADKKESNWKPTAASTTKLLLRGVRDSADAFGPLKSVAGGLYFILENCEVWSASTPSTRAHGFLSVRRQTNEQ